MNEIKKFAEQVVSNTTKNDKNYQFDPILILTVISVIVGIIRLMINCNLFGKNAYDRIQKPGIIDSVMINRIVNKQTPEEFKHLKNEIKNAVLEESKKISKESFNTMVEQVKTGKGI